MGGPHPPDFRDVRAQPLDAAILLGPRARRRHVRRPLPARGVRLPGPEPELDGDDRLLGRVRRVLLRAHLRAAPDLHRANDPAPERLVGLRPGAYVASKVTVLVPFLLLVIVGDAGRAAPVGPPARPPAVDVRLITVGLLLCAVAALGLGLLTSALVGNVAQATLALPMLCFPRCCSRVRSCRCTSWRRAGAALSVAMPSRWAFEAIGHDLGARRILADGGSRLGRRCSRRSATPAPGPPAPTG